ncbi:MAG TPA: hypothetical protein EYM25_03805 [Deltaproteobacteria bacterium]|nr:hypothetical protein [Deltaproteobacteria bacterium]
MESLVYWYSLVVGDILTPAIFVLFVIGSLLLFKRHYLVESEHQFAVSLQKGVTEYIQELYKKKQTLEFSQIVWEILKQARENRRAYAEAAAAKPKKEKPDKAEPQPTLSPQESDSSADSSNPFLRVEARAAFQASISDGKQSKFEPPTFDLESGKSKSGFSQKFTDYFDKRFKIENGIEQIIDNTLEQTIHCAWNQPDPNFFNIASYAFNYNPYFKRIWKLTFDSANSLLKTWSEILVMFGILGTFVGFFLALQSGEELKAGVSIAMVSSIVGMTLGVTFLLLEKSFTDDETAMTSVDIYKDSLELIWVNSKELYASSATYLFSRSTPSNPEATLSQ